MNPVPQNASEEEIEAFFSDAVLAVQNELVTSVSNMQCVFRISYSRAIRWKERMLTDEKLGIDYNEAELCFIVEANKQRERRVSSAVHHVGDDVPTVPKAITYQEVESYYPAALRLVRGKRVTTLLELQKEFDVEMSFAYRWALRMAADETSCIDYDENQERFSIQTEKLDQYRKEKLAIMLAIQAEKTVAAPMTAAEKRAIIIADKEIMAKLVRTEKALLDAMKTKQTEIDLLLQEAIYAEEYCFYRFYHSSFKVFFIQSWTEKAVTLLQSFSPEATFCPEFQSIIEQGTGRKFKQADNRQWSQSIRPLLEAFTHSRYFLKMASKYGQTIDEPPETMPYGWAALRHLYQIH